MLWSTFGQTLVKQFKASPTFFTIIKDFLYNIIFYMTKHKKNITTKLKKFLTPMKKSNMKIKNL